MTRTMLGRPELCSFFCWSPRPNAILAPGFLYAVKKQTEPRSNRGAPFEYVVADRTNPAPHLHHTETRPRRAARQAEAARPSIRPRRLLTQANSAADQSDGQHARILTTDALTMMVDRRAEAALRRLS